MPVAGQAWRDRPDHRRLCTRAGMTLDHTTVPGSAIMVPGIASATDEFAERETAAHGMRQWSSHAKPRRPIP
jgi:hypothetical protein